MKLNAIGDTASRSWIGLVDHFANIRLSKYVVMPNHLHGIISIQQHATHGARRTISAHPASTRIVAGSLPAIIRSFRAAVSKQARQLRKNISFEVWQRGYYEHIIRNQRDYENICEYIRLNPARWHLDDEKETYPSTTH